MAVLTRSFVVLVLAACFLSSLTVSAQEGEEEAGDNDPRVDPSEIVVPAMDSRAQAWVPLHERHSGEEGPGLGADSLNCGGRRACEDYKGNQTGAEAK